MLSFVSDTGALAELIDKDQVFAFVGSFSINDDGCVPVLQQCKCPDVGAARQQRHHDVLVSIFCRMMQRRVSVVI